ncbi:MAG: sulfatase-like hydrolase/transferase [Planctomycetaceae bacterium]|nr:sulfatase-like hydrolase/transferase [Planctomycetaceae bacterium]
MIHPHRCCVILLICWLTGFSQAYELHAQSEPKARNSLIRAYQELIEQSEFDNAEDVDELHQILLESDELLTRIKQSNAKAIKNVNRRPPRLATMPNVVLILVDNLSCQQLGCYGSESGKTPAIDQLAASGLQFSQFLSGSPLDQDAFWCLMTGRHAGEISRDKEGEPVLSFTKLTLSSHLWHAGYETGFFGNWPLPNTDPLECYCDLFVGWTDNSHPSIAYPKSINVNGRIQEWNQTEEASINAWSLTTAQALAALERRDSQRPFGWILRYHALNFPEVTSEIEMLDAEISRLLNRLDHLALREHTMIWLLGETSTTTPERNDVDETVNSLKNIHMVVPSIINGPRAFPGKHEASVLTGAWDVTATLTSIVRDRRYYRGTLGHSLAGTRFSNKSLDERVLYWSVPTATGDAVQAARWRTWKGVIRPGDPNIQLFDLKNDPREVTNVAQDHPEVLKKLIQQKPGR